MRAPRHAATLRMAAPSLTFDEMSAPDRSWTITPTLLWFGGLLVIGLWVIDGSVQAIADRLTARRTPGAASTAAGPTFTAPPVTVADRDDDDAPGVPAVSAGSGDRATGTALEDTCLDPGA